MSFHVFAEEVKSHRIALISLLIAIFAVTFTTWRDEESEKNRNIRMASFEALKHLGELQIVINYAHYQPDYQLGNPFFGWGHLMLINDMGELLPEPVPTAFNKLATVWGADWDKIKEDSAAVERITTEVDNSRNSVVNLIRHLR